LVRVSKFIGIKSVVPDFVLKDSKFTKHSIEFLESNFSTTFELEEFSLSHFLDKLSNVFFKLLNVE
jgi:hypothetical protein